MRSFLVLTMLCGFAVAEDKVEKPPAPPDDPPAAQPEDKTPIVQRAPREPKKPKEAAKKLSKLSFPLKVGDEGILDMPDAVKYVATVKSIASATEMVISIQRYCLMTVPHGKVSQVWEKNPPEPVKCWVAGYDTKDLTDDATIDLKDKIVSVTATKSYEEFGAKHTILQITIAEK